MNKNNKWAINIALLSLATLIAFVPLMIIDSEFDGADDKAMELVAEITDDEFEPLYEPIWEPPGGETESLIFALQAAFGSGIIFYCIGYMRGRRKSEHASEHVA